MEKTLFNKSEVADRLRISEGTLTTYGSRYPVYKADSAGVFHKDHVSILEKVRAKILTPEEGHALWQYQRQTMRRNLLGILNATKASKK
ncbi:MAG: hypothetical protein LIQ31_01735 [Planctomycetes bacterium]|nr:hypothetical protein [Planctomycetota bacterium]